MIRGDRAALAALILVGAALCAGCDSTAREARELTGGGDPVKGPVVMAKYGCPTCHTIPGVKGADGKVGPPLEQLATRVSIAGRLPNTPSNLMAWIQHPQQLTPGTVMPEMNVSERDARDIAAYLYTLR